MPDKIHHDPALSRMIQITVQTLAQNTDQHDRVVIDQLVVQGIERTLAEDLVIFIPVALTRVMLYQKGPTFSDEYWLTRGDSDEYTVKSLNENKVYRQAYDTFFHLGLPHNPLRIAGRSPEFKAINQALLDGAKPEDLVGGPLSVFVDE